MVDLIYYKRMNEILDLITKGISVSSILIIVYGTVVALIAIIRNEFSKNKYGNIRKIRAEFGSYLLLGLEVLIGADIIKTIVEPSYEELIILAGIVIVRTVMSVFLNREIKELEDKEDTEFNK